MKKIIAFVLVFVLTAALVTGCAKTDDTPTPAVPENTETGGHGKNIDYETIYARILNDFCSAAAGKTETIFDGATGVWEATMGRSPEEALGLVGYAIKDISGDGVPELIIGSLDENEETGMTYAVYSCANGAPQLVFEGYARSRMCYAGENSFIYHGSSGAAYTVCGEYVLSEDGTVLKSVDFYYTSPKNDDFENIGYYRNHTGEEGDVEEEITSEQFSSAYDAFYEKAQQLGLTPLTAVAKPELLTENTSAPAAEPAAVTGWWAEEVLQELADYEEYIAVEGEPQARVVFKTDAEVTNFKFRSLFLENVDEEGNLQFTETEMYGLDKLTPDCPLLVDLVFVGDTPQYGISYTDTDGSIKNFAVAVSGYDGSIELIEYK